MFNVTPEEDEAWQEKEKAKTEQLHDAFNILVEAGKHLGERALTYDNIAGERSMATTVAMFNELVNANMTEEEGWMFMAILKMVRSQQGRFKADNYEDGAAYFALACEAASKARNQNN